MNLDIIIQRYCTDRAIAIFSNKYIDNIFSILFNKSPYVNSILYKMKIMELLSYIYFYDLSREKRITEWNSQQVYLIKEIHDFLTENYGKRYTIEELSKKYLINTSSLKSTFKAVYGMPIATYMKEYRMKIAIDLLINSTDTIFDIANQLGYETQSKFSKAFKDVMNILPSEYRKTNKNSSS
ncbi:AraC family transcriptional regulator [Thomasclavelia sp.]|uniref:helix-turn-helix domain-containing protein n=1 Tax=Thomasclavelia sp. TaxID=3025757 RepID=UPI0025CDD6C8|nr:AraC family transcriptional regulator [Thomasclavelia sp.]